MLKQFLRRVNYRRCRENNKLISSFSGQGTIEYLVIIGVVIVLSLVVVGLVITQVDNSSNVSSVSSEVAFKVGVGGISLASSVVGVDGNGLLVIKNVNSENIVLSKVVVDGVDHNFYEQIVAGDEKSFKLQDVASCESGAKSKSYLVKVEYVSASGLTKIADFEKIRIDCAPVVIPASIVVEEVIIANVVPSIELNSPIDNNSTAETRVSFVFTPSDSDGIITSCSLNLTGSMDANSSFSIVQGEENTLEYTLSIGEYDWNITCMDDDGDTNTSETRTLIIEQPTHTGNAVLFNGTDTYATFGKTTYEATMTFSVWIKLNGTGKTQEIVQAQGSSKAVFFRVSGTEQIYFRKEGTTVDFTCDTVLDTGEWYHVVGIFDGSNGGKVYLNGELDGQDTGTITLTTGYSRSEIGQHNWGIERFDGLMDQLLIFNRAISEAEVLQLYNSGDGLYADVTVAPFNSGLVVGYNFDESSGSTLSDLTGTYNATLYNGTFVPGKSFAISST